MKFKKEEVQSGDIGLLCGFLTEREFLTKILWTQEWLKLFIIKSYFKFFSGFITVFDVDRSISGVLRTYENVRENFEEI